MAEAPLTYTPLERLVQADARQLDLSFVRCNQPLLWRHAHPRNGWNWSRPIFNGIPFDDVCDQAKLAGASDGDDVCPAPESWQLPYTKPIVLVLHKARKHPYQENPFFINVKHVRIADGRNTQAR